MRSSRLFGAVVLVLALALGLIAPLAAIADTASHRLEVPIGDPGGSAAGDPNDGSGSGIVWIPPAPMTLPELVAQLEYRIYLSFIANSSQTQTAVARSTQSRCPKSARLSGSNRP